MKRIRINNDFTFAWAIERNGLPEDLSTAINMVLRARNARGVLQAITDYTVAGNMVSIEVTPDIANVLGKYNFILTYELPDVSLSDNERLCEIDTDAFIIVPRTAEADDSQNLLVTSDMAIGFKGDKGDAFVYEDFTESQLSNIKQPAIDAAALVIDAIGNLSLSETQRDNNEAARIFAETQRQTQETARAEADANRAVIEAARVSAENIRETADSVRTAKDTAWNAAESARAGAETARAAAESTRVTKETERMSAESDRVTAENSRTSAETARKAVETGRVSAESTRGLAETARINAETARVNADNARTAKDTAWTAAESARAGAETARAAAESTRVTKETERMSAESDRVTAETARINAETTRVNADNARTAKDTAWTAAESARAGAETARAAAESTRVTKETERTAAESGRVSAETARVNAENTRQAVYLSNSTNWYGVIRSRTLADPAFTRIGNMQMHATKPMHNLIRGCKVNESREIVNYLHATNWALNDDSSTSKLDGTDGLDVAVCYPESYVVLDGGDADWEIWAVGEAPFTVPYGAGKTETAIHVSKFVAAPDYCTVDRTTNKTRCVRNDTDTNLAGSGAGATAGGLGYPRTVVSRYNFELYATNKGILWNNWIYLDYLVLQMYLYTEYATRNLKSVFGNLAVNWASADWSAYNGYYPVIKILEAHLAISGTPAVLSAGHLTGVYSRSFSFDNAGTAVNYTTGFGVYRGMILWGHLWKWISGIEYEIQSAADGGLSNVYVSLDPRKTDNNRTNDSFLFKNSYQLMGQASRTAGWGKEGIPKSGQAKTIGGGETTHMCGYYYTETPASGTARRGVLFGARLDNGSTASLSYASSNFAPSYSDAYFGGGFRAEVK